MARQERNDADYFPFYAKDGRTLFILQAKYKLAGIGFFTQLMRTLCTTPYHILDLSDPVQHLYILTKLGADDEKLADEMLDLLASTGKIDKELWTKKRVIFSQDFMDSLNDLYAKRSNKQITREEIYERYFHSDPETPYNSTETPYYGPDCPGNNEKRPIFDNNSPVIPQSKVKERKEKESKEDEEQSGPDCPVRFSSHPQRPIIKCNDSSERIETLRTTWNNYGLVEMRRTILNFTQNERTECLSTLSVYTNEEIITAMQNYKRVISEPEYDLPPQFQYKTFQGFIGKGVEKFMDNAKPFEIYKKRQQQAQGKKQGLVTTIPDIDF